MRGFCDAPRCERKATQYAVSYKRVSDKVVRSAVNLTVCDEHKALDPTRLTVERFGLHGLRVHWEPILSEAPLPPAKE